jgi:cell division protein FtsQ
MARNRALIESLLASGRIWLTAFGWLAFCVSAAIAARKVERFVSTDPQFTLSPERRDAIAVSGAVYASRAKVTRVFAPDFGRSLYLIPLAERRRRLLAIDWVEEASVSRIWPDHILVRITERKPVAFVNVPLTENSRASRLALIDTEGVFLDPPPKAKFAFPVLEGVSERQTEDGRRKRVLAMRRLIDDLGPLAKEVSEINAANIEDLRIIVQVERRALELEIGDGNYARRLQHFLSHYAEIRRRTPGATAFDLRLDDRIITKD